MNSNSILGEDLEEDSFLPNSRSGLAGLFTKPVNPSNETLKYTPLKPQKFNDLNDAKENVTSSNTDTTSKTSECILGKVVHAHELVKGVYVSKGKLGLAIMRILNPPHTRLVIFDAAKNTLSSVVASENLNVTIQSGNYITYYDENAKNWSLLFSSLSDLEEVINELKIYNVHTNKFENLQSDINAEQMQNHDHTKTELQNDCKEDSTSSMKNKSCLINRMATMGQAILPPNLLPNIDSASSDENTEPSIKPPPPPKHKGMKKSIVTKMAAKIKHSPDSSDSSSEVLENIKTPGTVTMNTPAATLQPFTYIQGQVVPLSNEFSNNNFNSFISETRMNNSEVRININRISDKVDQVLDRLKASENSISVMPTSANVNTNFTLEVYKKLLREYEDKITTKDNIIKLLEEQLKTNKENLIKNEDAKTLQEYDSEIKLKQEIYSYKNEIERLNSVITENSSEIESLKLKMENLLADNDCLRENNVTLMKGKEDSSKLTDRILKLENDISLKEKECLEITASNLQFSQSLENITTKSVSLKEAAESKINEIGTQCNNLEIKQEIKKIINNTYKALAAKFELDLSYSSTDIRNIIATVMKETTLEILADET